MASNRKQQATPLNEKIDVSAFKDIQIYFPGDVYILAVWLAMSARAQSRPGHVANKTLFGLATNFAYLNAFNQSGAVNREEVMKIFAQHGITGNPMLTLEIETQESDSHPLIDNSMSFLSASTIIAPPPHGTPE